jgi:hypothetical protein
VVNAPAGVQILASLDSKWTPRDLFRDVEASIFEVYVLLGLVLVDLVRFELTTSSMPFKKYQSLADSSTRNKRLSTRPRGLRWTPRGGFWGVWTPRGLRDSTPGTGTWRAFLRAVAGCSICCLPKETTIGFHIRMVPMWDAEGVAFRPRGAVLRKPPPSLAEF